MLRTHLTVLDSAVARFGSEPAFKLPQRDSSGALLGWNSISYEQFHRDVERVAKYWSQTLAQDNIPPRSVVGLWIGGWTYDDVLHVYGISRAGYIPQLFTIRLPNPVVIFELLAKANAKALIAETSFAGVITNSPVPVHLSIAHTSIGATDSPLAPLPQFGPDDIAFYLHTSGSTSGSPKVIPYTYRWLESTVSKTGPMATPCKPGRLDTVTWVGSVCHVAQTSMFIAYFQHGTCILLPTTPAYSDDEFAMMISKAGLTRLNIFAPLLDPRLRNARNDAKLLSLLQGLDDIIYCGGMIPREQEEWAAKNNINVRNLFGSTECGGTLISKGGYGPDSGHLRPAEGTSYAFVPTSGSGSNEEGPYQSTARLLEFVVLSDSPDCPPAQFRSADGHFHTGDLFQAASAGTYIFRGRDDDWIKTENALRCDTKAIEDNVRTACGNMVGECVVVGWGRPSPALLVEPANGDMDHDKLKREILRKTRHFHSRRYLHERITSPDLIIIVAPKSLPRTATKGNVRRKTAEEMFKPQLDTIYERLRT